MSEFDQSNLDLTTETASGPVECLGQTFESDDARREHYTELLREKLKDPEFRKIEGFPIGEDEDILALSDPPYYTACPNPWIEDFVKHHGRPYDPDEKYQREPFAADVSEGKGHSIYKAHSYHTKVPHRAIMRYILHYTEPGDIVLDGFCGTGMTGVAAQLCGDRSEVQELGCRVDQSGAIIDESGVKFSRFGRRVPVLNDLSTVASFISFNYNSDVNSEAFENETKRILQDVEVECGWMFKTHHENGSIGRINYTVYSDVFICSECTQEIIFHDTAFDEVTFKVLSEFRCPHCNALHTKRKLERASQTVFDDILKKTIKLAKQVPVLINYSYKSERFNKKPDKFDLNLIQEIEGKKIVNWIPTTPLPPGVNTSQPIKSHGFTYAHQFYTRRALLTLSKAYSAAKTSPEKIRRYLIYAIEQSVLGLSKVARYVPSHFSQVNQYLSGTLYVGSQVVDVSLDYIMKGKFKRLIAMLSDKNYGGLALTQTGSASSLLIPRDSIDYIFIDPPFGSNLNYSELNFFWESWLGVITNNKTEAIENKVQQKTLDDYRELMSSCFKEAYRVLKPGRWVTVEFSNTKASVWNSIQSALSQSGFVVANVSALDKKQGTFKAITTSTAVKQDLVISAYKPSKQLELQFLENSDRIESVWDFIDSHLSYLPVSKAKGGTLEFITERDPRILYDRMVAYFIRNTPSVPVSSGEFQAALDDKYPARDGMVFLPEQVAQYDKLAAKMESVGQMVVFVEDEKSAIGWLRQFLKDKPSTYQGIHPDFTQQLSASWRKFETRPELSVLLDQNFLKYSGEGDVPVQISSHLSKYYPDLTLEKLKRRDDPKLQAKAKDRWYVPDPKKMADVEAQREKKLLSEFWEYAAQAGVERGQTQTSQTNLPLGESTKKKSKVKKLKEVRTDAVRAGFMECQRNNQGAVILAVAEILPADVIDNDERLQMIYDFAVARSE